MRNGRRITIQGSGKILTEQSGLAYYIKSGLVYVYIVPYKDVEPCRRYFLMECSDGDVITGINRDEVFLEKNDIRRWHLLIVPMKQSEIIEYEADNASYSYFAKKLGVEYNNTDQLELDIIEKYRLNQLKYLRNAYAGNKSKDEAKKHSFKTILQQFSSSRIKKDTVTSKSPLYSAVAYICGKNNIDIIPYAELNSACHNRFTIEDIARLSGFPIRRISLAEKWYKKDCGNLLVFDQESGKPLVAVQKSSTSYQLVEPISGNAVKITSDVADCIMSDAYSFYRPLPSKALSIKDIMLYAMSQLKLSDILFAIAIAAVGSLVTLLIPYLNEKIYDMYIPFGDDTGLKYLCALLISVMLGNVAFSLVKGFASFRNSSRVGIAVDAALIDRVFNISDTDIGDVESADLVQRLLGISSIFSVVFEIIMQQGLGLLMSFVFFIRMYSYSPLLANTGLVMVLIITVILSFAGYSGYKISNKQLAIDGKISSLLFQLISGVSKLKMAGAVERAMNQYITEYSEEMGLTKKLNYRNKGIKIISEAATLIFSIVLFYTMIRNSVGISVGQYMGFNSAFTSFSGAFIGIAATISNIGLMMPTLERAKVLLNSVPETEIEKAMPIDISGDIEINNLKFAYSEDGPVILDDINLHIHPGEYIGIVGSSGCGKSTLLKLILGFEKPIEGKIFYDGQDIDGINKKQLRRNLGIVLQDGAIISGSIADNIRLTEPQASVDDVTRALETVGLKEDVDAMPMGLNTYLSEGAGQISGGQKQRLLIARAIISNPKILLFDEATSALDNVTQAHLADSLARLNSTRIVIAHRLSTVQQCDRIIVLDKGHIVETGTFDELMAADGLFAQFAKRQIN